MAEIVQVPEQALAQVQAMAAAKVQEQAQGQVAMAPVLVSGQLKKPFLFTSPMHGHFIRLNY